MSTDVEVVNPGNPVFSCDGRLTRRMPTVVTDQVNFLKTDLAICILFMTD